MSVASRGVAIVKNFKSRDATDVLQSSKHRRFIRLVDVAKSVGEKKKICIQVSYGTMLGDKTDCASLSSFFFLLHAARINSRRSQLSIPIRLIRMPGAARRARARQYERRAGSPREETVSIRQFPIVSVRVRVARLKTFVNSRTRTRSLISIYRTRGHRAFVIATRTM